MSLTKGCDGMSKENKKLIVALIALLIVTSIFLGSSEKGTIIEFDENTVIIESEDGNNVTRIDNYFNYIPTGEEWSVGDKVKIQNRLFGELRIHRIA